MITATNGNIGHVEAAKPEFGKTRTLCGLRIRADLRPRSRAVSPCKRCEKKLNEASETAAGRGATPKAPPRALYGSDIRLHRVIAVVNRTNEYGAEMTTWASACGKTQLRSTSAIRPVAGATLEDACAECWTEGVEYDAPIAVSPLVPMGPDAVGELLHEAIELRRQVGESRGRQPASPIG